MTDKCMECYEEVATLPDPREPPLETVDCLCQNCYDGAADEQVEELQGQIESILSLKSGEGV